METLGSVSITALLHRLIMLCAVMFETTWHTRSGLHLQARAPPLTVKTAQKQLKEHKKHNQGYWPDLSTTPRSQSDQACTELFRTHLIFWGSKQQPQKPKDQFLTSHSSGWETPQDTLRYVCVIRWRVRAFLWGRGKPRLLEPGVVKVVAHRVYVHATHVISMFERYKGRGLNTSLSHPLGLLHSLSISAVIRLILTSC